MSSSTSSAYTDAVVTLFNALYVMSWPFPASSSQLEPPQLTFKPTAIPSSTASPRLSVRLPTQTGFPE